MFPLFEQKHSGGMWKTRQGNVVLARNRFLAETRSVQIVMPFTLSHEQARQHSCCYDACASLCMQHLWTIRPCGNARQLMKSILRARPSGLPRGQWCRVVNATSRPSDMSQPSPSLSSSIEFVRTNTPGAKFGIGCRFFKDRWEGRIVSGRSFKIFMLRVPEMVS